jgi:plasmid stabilization system protein ParE
MAFSVVLSPDAINDIDIAFEYYNKLSDGLGFEFTDTIDAYLKKIAQFPTASAIRYDNIRVKPVEVFPFTIHFLIADETTVIILRVFNTYQKPIT